MDVAFTSNKIDNICYVNVYIFNFMSLLKKTGTAI
jgi:hypothetical protein